MFSIKKTREIEPELENQSDCEVLNVIKDMYELAELAFEKWQKDSGSKYPTRTLLCDT